MTLLDLLLYLWRRYLRRHLATRLNGRVRVLLPAPFYRRKFFMTRVLAKAGAEVADITCAPTRDDGTAGKLDGPVTWSSSDLYTVSASEDGLTAKIFATGQTGAVTITAKADGDLGPNVFSVSQDFEFEFVAESEPLTTHINGTVSVLLPAPEAPAAPAGAF